MFLFQKKSNSSEAPNEGMTPAEGSLRKGRIKVGLVASVIVLIIAGSLGTAGYFYHAYKKALTQVVPAADEISTLTEKISRIAELPSSETPTLATVSDISKLSGQNFFERAQNGDKILIYTGAGLAYIYRPSTGKIINISQLNTQDVPQGGGDQVASTPAPEQVLGEEATQPVEEKVAEPEVPAKPARIALYNGTGRKGLTSIFEKEFLSEKEGAFEVVAKENASSAEYQETVIVDLTNNQSVRAQQLADKLGISIADGVPNGEVSPPDTDILVILGADIK